MTGGPDGGPGDVGIKRLAQVIGSNREATVASDKGGDGGSDKISVWKLELTGPMGKGGLICWVTFGFTSRGLVMLTWPTFGTRVYYEKKASQRRQFGWETAGSAMGRGGLGSKNGADTLFGTGSLRYTQLVYVAKHYLTYRCT